MACYNPIKRAQVQLLRRTTPARNSNCDLGHLREISPAPPNSVVSTMVMFDPGMKIGVSRYTICTEIERRSRRVIEQSCDIPKKIDETCKPNLKLQLSPFPFLCPPAPAATVHTANRNQGWYMVRVSGGGSGGRCGETGGGLCGGWRS
eukprot:3428051-Rhodomonas_salina.1